jgi:hypothetical protein
MTASILHDCPYCGGKNCSFNIKFELASKRDAYTWFTLAECSVCKIPAIAVFSHYKSKRSSARHAASPISTSQSARISAEFSLTDFIPNPPKPDIADDIPENVKTPLLEAEIAYASGMYSAAGSCYRKAMERAAKHINADAKGMLNKRIRDIEKDGLLPPAMIELLDQVRLFGNEAMHEDDFDPSKDDCTAAREFSKLFLTYAFSMPAKINRAKSDVESRE